MMKRSIYLIAICMCLAIALTGCGKKTVDMTEYVTVDFSGYDTYGTAEVNLWLLLLIL